MKRAVKIVGITLASLAGLFVAASAAVYLFVDLDAVIAEQVERYRPMIEEELGREVEVGPIHTRFFPRLGARIQGVTIAAEAEEQAPLLHIGEAGFDVDLLRAILSGGQRIVVSAIYVDGLRLRVERDAEGRLSFQDILDRRQPAPKAEGAPDEGLSPTILDLVGNVSIGEIRLAGAAIDFIDHQTATGAVAESHIDQIDLRLRDVKLSDPVGIDLSAAIFSSRKNLRLHVQVGPLPADLKMDGLPTLRGLHAELDSIDLAPLAPYLGDAMPARVDSALVSARYDLPLLASGQPLTLDGFLAVEGLRVEGGEAFDLRIDSKLRADPKSLSATIESLRIQAAEMELAMAGALHDLGSAPRFEDFTIRSKSIDTQRIAALYPPAFAGLPAGSRLAGPLSIDVEASGGADQQTAKVAIILDEVDIHIPGVLAKPRATPLSLRIAGDFSPTAATLHSSTFQIDELALQVKGKVENFEAPVYDFSLSAAPFSFDRLVRLAPTVGEELRKAGASASGRGSVEGHLRGAPGQVDTRLAVALEGVELHVPQTQLQGSLRLDASAKGNPTGDLSVALLLDAGSSVIRVDELMNKAAGTPLRVDVAASRHGESFRFERFDVQVAELAMQASGSLSGDGAGDLSVRLLPVDLEGLARTFPMLPADKLRGGSMEGELQVTGAPTRLETIVLQVPRFEARFGPSDLRAEATVRNLEAPEITASLHSNHLDLDALQGPQTAPEAKEKKVAADNPALKKIRMEGSFDAKRVALTGRQLESVRATITLRDGVFRVEEGRFGIYGGSFQADGTTAEVWRGTMPFHLRFEGKGVDLGRLIVAETGRSSPVNGKGDLHLDLAGVGIEKIDLEKHLSGDWNLSMREGRASGLGLSQAVFGDLSGLPGFASSRVAKEEPLRDLLAGFEVRDGKMALKKPLSVMVDGNPVILDGSVGIFGELQLAGTYTLGARRIAQLTGGLCQAADDPTIPLQITGTAARPAVRPDGGQVALALAKACLADRAGAVVDKLLGDGATEKLKDAAGGLGSKAAEEAQAAKALVDQEAARAKAELDAAKAEADRKRKEAEDAAKKKAREAADRLKKSVGF